jgi:hypothetical protein
LTTLELDFGELEQLMGRKLAEEYISLSESCLIWRWDPYHRDPYYGTMHGGWSSRCGWRVQYMFGEFRKRHICSSSPAGIHRV